MSKFVPKIKFFSKKNPSAKKIYHSSPEDYFAVIIAGGSGTRLWPKSRKKTPKHLLNLFGDGSLLKQTYNRISKVIPKDRIWIVTHQDHVQIINNQLPDFPNSKIIAEPVAKGTAMAMGIAAATIQKINPNAIIFNLWADQMFDDLSKFQDSVLTSLEAAAIGDSIVTIGIRPTFPHTGLGYIRVGEQEELDVKGVKDAYVFRGKGFKEKPNIGTAQSFVASGQYLWNTGLYCWSVSTIMDAFTAYSPHIAKALKVITDSNKNTNDLIAEVYNKVGNPDSIDYEVSEKAKNILVVPGNFGWSDVGDWKVVYDVSDKDKEGNVVPNEKTEVISINAGNNFIEANGRLIAIVGLKDIAVVDTEDALLICAKDKTQDVKKVVEKLKEQKKDKYL